jgi:hypothetical protein
MQARSGACPRRDSTPLGKAPAFHSRLERHARDNDKEKDVTKLTPVVSVVKLSFIVTDSANKK